MPILQRDRTHLFYDVMGPEGTPQATLTLINGHTRSSSDFKMLAKRLAAQRIRVVTLDNRGAGKTVTEGPFSVQDMLDDVIAVWDTLQMESSAVLGISMGGLIAQALAALHVRRVSKLILVSTCADRKHLLRGDEGWVTDAQGIEDKMRTYFAPGFVAKNELLIRSMAKQTLKAIQEGDFLTRSEAQRQAIVKFGGANLERIAAPTLIVHGDEDHIIDVAGGRDLARRIRGAKLEILPGAGHLLLAEKPQELCEATINFLLN